MATGDWVQSIIGGVGILATLFVGWMVFRLERRDRASDRREERREAARRDEAVRQQEAARVEAEAERERRELQRDQHGDDYRAATQALNRLADAFEKAKNAFLTESEVEAAGVQEAVETLDSIGRRVPGLGSPFRNVRAYAGTLHTFRAPDAWRFAAAVRATEPEEVGAALAELVREAVTRGREQYEGALGGLKFIERARQAIATEWGA